MLGAADIYCQPNTEAEGFGLALVEALGASLPVVTTGLGGAAEVVDDSCGVSVPANDPRAVAKALHLLIEDPVRRAQMGKAGRQRAALICDPARQIARLESIVAGLSHEATGGLARGTTARVGR
jgi:glycosyltransferase involved in cell wall biosynthesis